MKKYILIVDDEPNVRLNYRMALETEGCLVTEANCGAKALHELEIAKFDLAILDMRMPEMDGLELLAEMRKRGHATPSIIVTAYGDVPHAVQAMKLGAIDFLQKPLTPGQLRQMASEVLGRHEEPVAADPGETDPSVSAEELHRRYLQTAKRFINRQQFPQAQKILAKALALDPVSIEAFNLTGVLFEIQEDYDRAKKFYGQAIKLDGHYEPAQQNMRRIYELFQFGSSKEPFNLGGD